MTLCSEEVLVRGAGRGRWGVCGGIAKQVLMRSSQRHWVRVCVVPLVGGASLLLTVHQVFSLFIFFWQGEISVRKRD